MHHPELWGPHARMRLLVLTEIGGGQRQGPNLVFSSARLCKRGGVRRWADWRRKRFLGNVRTSRRRAAGPSRMMADK